MLGLCSPSGGSLWPEAIANSLSTGLPLRKNNRTEWTVVCFLAFKHQGTVVLFKIVNYVCLRKCQCFLKQNNRAGKDQAMLFVAKVSCRKMMYLSSWTQARILETRAQYLLSSSTDLGRVYFLFFYSQAII